MSLNEESTERIRLSTGKDADLGILNVIQKMILPHHEESSTKRKNPETNCQRRWSLYLATGGKDTHVMDNRA